MDSMEIRVKKLERSHKKMRKTLLTVYNRYYGKCVRAERHGDLLSLSKQRFRAACRNGKKQATFLKKVGHLIGRVNDGKTIIRLDRNQYAKLMVWLHCAKRKNKYFMMPKALGNGDPA